MAGSRVRKSTNEGSGGLLAEGAVAASRVDLKDLKDLKNLAQDLTGLCAKECNRRISDNKFKELYPDYEKPSEEQPGRKQQMRGSGEAMPKSPQVFQHDGPRNALASLADTNQNNLPARERFNSAFKKYDPKEACGDQQNPENQTSGQLQKNNSGLEPTLEGS